METSARTGQNRTELFPERNRRWQHLIRAGTGRPAEVIVYGVAQEPSVPFMASGHFLHSLYSEVGISIVTPFLLP